MNDVVGTDDVVYGNYEDKYHSRNLIARQLMNGFLSDFKQALYFSKQYPMNRICEVGCAEGELLKRTHEIFPSTTLMATDISEDEVNKAKKNCSHIPKLVFSVQDAQDLSEYENRSFDLVICCEVLEHLPDPERGYAELLRICNRHLLVSVPNEPFWRILNMIRGKYLCHWGNTPGHINHWTIGGFQRFINEKMGVRIVNRYFPLPWQMYLLEITSEN